ncbi:efflux RND transporter periplasmic adaptor subunit [uncultured Paraglaciecola sp.]|uniref:efflux RND transporter periplasmic adaptor subunit n=1 Tax=uncultured Paraglaciecola sp. TaxID=1765024 RepID=UPI0025953011|nr:efflux RND transporter periplasmic adaptor subunit [uncultured Paraglaciecola sp.]
MNNAHLSKPNGLGITLGLIMGIGISALCYWAFITPSDHASNEVKSSDAPLYWVAPMDPNFKRDKPGKSPMGMDLVPVYKTEKTKETSKGTVEIEPSIVNNLGVKTTEVTLISPSVDIRAFGRVEYAQNLMVHVHARVEGWVETLYVRSAGEFIEKDTPLYDLYSPELVNAQEELLLALKQGNARLIQAAQSRLEALNVPATLVDSLKQTQKVQRTVTFTAPQSGFVNNLQIQEGFFVTPSKTLLSVAPTNQVWVIASIFAEHANFIKEGQKASITSEYFPNTKLSSQVEYIYPSLHYKTKTLQVRFLLDNPGFLLKPEMFVDVFLQLDIAHGSDKHSTKVLAVPVDAVIRTGLQDRVVLALEEGKFKSIEVGVGRKLGDYYEITNGLSENDKIVTSAQFLIDSESSITSDFKRMAADEDSSDTFPAIKKDNQQSAWTLATVNEVFIEDSMLNLTHGPLDTFSMMGMTMDFLVAENLDMTQFKENQDIHVEIVKTASGMFQVKTIHFTEQQSPKVEMPSEPMEMDHSKHHRGEH